MLRLHGIEQLQAVKPAALQPYVQINKAGPPARDMRKRIVAVACRSCDVAFVLQNAGNELPDVCLVVHNEDIVRHGSCVGYKLRDSSFFCRLWRGGGCALGRKRQTHPRTPLAGNLVCSVGELDAPAMVLENAADDGETK